MKQTAQSTCSIDQNAYLQPYLSYLQNFRRCSPNTVKAYRNDAEDFLKWFAQNDVPLRPNQITKEVLFRYLTSLNHLSANTIRRKIHALGSWFKYSIDCGAMRENPAQGLPLPRRERQLPKYPTSEQSEKLLSAAKSPLELAVIWLLLTTGVRRAELVALDLGDLRSNGSELHVTGKGNKERMVPLPLRTQTVLDEYLNARGDSAGPLLRNRAGNRIGYTSLRRMFNRLLRRAGLDDCGFTLHSTRHAYATMLVKAGVDLGTVRDLLGHSDISVTSVYVHSDLRSKKTAVEQLPILAAGGGVGE